jgi:hypothetical protein
MKEFKVPKHLEAEFKSFLDIAQFNFPADSDPLLAEGERKILRYVRTYLGDDLSTRE